MRLAAGIFLIPFASGLCQADDGALRLLREVNATARSLKSWRAEGVEVSRLTTRETDVRSEVHFSIAVQSPLKMRRAHTGDDHTQTVCDGADVFYTGDGNSFYRYPQTASKGCNFALSDFYELVENPVSASLTGHDGVQIGGASRECNVLREEWNSELPGGPKSHYVRTLCIDTETHLILRDRTEGTDTASGLHSVIARTFSLLDTNPELSPETFSFSVPTGAIQDRGPQVSQEESIPVNGVYPIGSGIPHPRLISKVEPVYTREARVLKISGLSLVSLEVNGEGWPQHAKVIRGLGHGLEEKALDAVYQWRFEPVVKDGGPVSIGPITVAVYFQLP